MSTAIRNELQKCRVDENSGNSIDTIPKSIRRRWTVVFLAAYERALDKEEDAALISCQCICLLCPDETMATETSSTAINVLFRLFKEFQSYMDKLDIRPFLKAICEQYNANVTFVGVGLLRQCFTERQIWLSDRISDGLCRIVGNDRSFDAFVRAGGMTILGEGFPLRRRDQYVASRTLCVAANLADTDMCAVLLTGENIQVLSNLLHQGKEGDALACSRLSAYILVRLIAKTYESEDLFALWKSASEITREEISNEIIKTVRGWKQPVDDGFVECSFEPNVNLLRNSFFPAGQYFALWDMANFTHPEYTKEKSKSVNYTHLLSVLHVVEHIGNVATIETSSDPNLMELTQYSHEIIQNLADQLDLIFGEAATYLEEIRLRKRLKELLHDACCSSHDLLRKLIDLVSDFQAKGINAGTWAELSKWLAGMLYSSLMHNDIQETPNDVCNSVSSLLSVNSGTDDAVLKAANTVLCAMTPLANDVPNFDVKNPKGPKVLLAKFAEASGSSPVSIGLQAVGIRLKEAKNIETETAGENTAKLHAFVVTNLWQCISWFTHSSLDHSLTFMQNNGVQLFFECLETFGRDDEVIEHCLATISSVCANIDDVVGEKLVKTLVERLKSARSRYNFAESMYAALALGFILDRMSDQLDTATYWQETYPSVDLEDILKCIGTKVLEWDPAEYLPYYEPTAVKTFIRLASCDTFRPVKLVGTWMLARITSPDRTTRDTDLVDDEVSSVLHANIREFETATDPGAKKLVELSKLVISNVD